MNKADQTRTADALERCANALELLALAYVRQTFQFPDPDADLAELADWQADLIKKGWLGG